MAAKGKLNKEDKRVFLKKSALWFQLEDIFQLVGMPQGIEHAMVQFTDMSQDLNK